MSKKPWNEQCNCQDCDLQEKLMCNPSLKYSLYFGIPLLLGIIPPIIGIIISDFTLLSKIVILLGWLIYALFFFMVWESRIICNHCPYYADESQKTLHCPINKFMLKTSKYDPSQISGLEKIQFIIGATILIGYPIPFLIIDGQIIPILFLIGGTIIWIIVAQLEVCSDCINFSCILNRVPENIRDKFLKKTPIIQKAWEEEGYEID